MKVNHKSLIIFIFILFILFIFFKSIQNSDSPDFEHLSDEWPEACKKLKENYKSETYIARPRVATKACPRGYGELIKFCCAYKAG